MPPDKFEEEFLPLDLLRMLCSRASSLIFAYPPSSPSSCSVSDMSLTSETLATSLSVSSRSLANSSTEPVSSESCCNDKIRSLIFIIWDYRITSSNVLLLDLMSGMDKKTEEMFLLSDFRTLISHNLHEAYSFKYI